MNLHLLQLADSALPIGGYSHSWGLEAAIDRGLVRAPLGLEHWVRCWLRLAVGPFEGVIVASVCRSAAAHDWRQVHTANELLWAGLPVPTLRQASRDMGEQLLSLSEAWPWATGIPAALRRLAEETPDFAAWHHAPVFGSLCAAANCSPRDAVAAYLHQAALGGIGAGVRAVPIGHTHGQQILARLHDAIQELAVALENRELATAGSFCPAYEILCAAQQLLYTRLFRS